MNKSSALNFYRLFPVLAILVGLLTLAACPMNDLPRNMRLKAFNPYRPDFICKHEADAVPAVTQEAEHLFQQGMAATSYELWPDDRDYKSAAGFWQQAATLGHWKAAMNLAGLYERGLGIERNREQAVRIIEGLMQQGVPAAFDRMGSYHQNSMGVNQSTDRAWAFWQLAADMGNPTAQTFIGERLNAAYDSEEMGVWANSKVGIKMLECAVAQGYGKAAFELGVSLNIGKKDYARALHVLHEGVKFGSDRAASYLSASFNYINPLTGNLIDKARVKRYSTLAGALRLNPDLRFPNLDKVLPLPPAELPFWDGKRETLIEAAKQVIPAAVSPAADSPPAPATVSQRTGRTDIPSGYVLPEHPLVFSAPWQAWFDRHLALPPSVPDASAAPIDGSARRAPNQATRRAYHHASSV